MLAAHDALNMYQLITSHGLRLWICGGWGVDALLEQETRPHHDLDVLMLLGDVTRLRRQLARHGYRLKEYWEENRWVTDGAGKRIATAFVLWDAQERELDVHALHMDTDRNGIPDWENSEGFIFTPKDLDGEGLIAGEPVACLSAAMQMHAHSGYQIPEKQFGDIEGLHRKFGVDYPRGYNPRRASPPLQTRPGGE
jgi:lincosamide nucleotidyltransferase A/C/D/E